MAVRIVSVFKFGLFLLLGVYFVGVELKFEGCMEHKPVFNPELEVLRYGKPTPFVTTRSIGLGPYTLIDPYLQSSLYHEYLLIGPGIANYDPKILENPELQMETDEEEIQLVLYDEESTRLDIRQTNLINQNLVKEYMWAMINATGMLPSMTVINTTFETTFRFHTDEEDTVAYHLAYPNLFRSREPVPPMDVIIEFPAKTRMFQTLKTMIDYQTFGLLRWRLTPTPPVTWSDLREKYGDWVVTIKDPNLCRLPPETDKGFKEVDFLQCVYNKRFHKAPNPCIKDMVILYTFGAAPPKNGSDESNLSVNRLFIIIPMVYDLLLYKGWYDITDVYCPHPNVPEECSEPQEIVLTNDHLLILTDRGLWVSNSLNTSNVNVSLPYSLKPLAKWSPVDPCVSFDFFNCSEVGTPTLAQQAIRRQRLFYTPICHLFQYPIYEDMVMIVYDHVSQAPDKSHERNVFTVLYASKPYKDWKLLFHARYEYETVDGPLAIMEIIGIFFNHHRRHFDISVILADSTGTERTFRFVLPLPTDPEFKGYTELNGLLGNGFLEFEFPRSFHMLSLTVNPEPLDVLFMGNQIWVAEAAGPFVYLSLPVVLDWANDPSTITECDYNHPDRTFVCVEKSHSVIYPGRVGTNYSPVSVLFEHVYELRFTMLHNLWPLLYKRYTAVLGTFVMGYSGKVMLWYIYDHNDVVSAQLALVSQRSPFNGTAGNCDDEDFTKDQPVSCHICQAITSRVHEDGCTIRTLTDDEHVPSFRMVSFDPTILQGRDTITSGPLVPFLIDGDKVLLFEATVPELPGYKPDYDYYQDVDEGSSILCHQRSSHSLPSPMNQTGTGVTNTSTSGGKIACPQLSWSRVKHFCELYVRHMKSLERDGKQVFLKGFRRSLFATVIGSFPMRPIPTDLVVLVLPNSNDAIIQLGDLMFDPGTDNKYYFRYEDVGRTLYIPDQFSVLLTGFSKFQSCKSQQGGPSTQGEPLLHDMTRMVGIVTRYFRQGFRVKLKPFHSYIIDFTTPSFCEYYKMSLQSLNSTQCEIDPNPRDITSQQYKDRLAETNRRRIEEWENRQTLVQALNEYYKKTFNNEQNAQGSSSSSSDLFKNLQDLKNDYDWIEEDLLQVGDPAVGTFQTNYLQMNLSYTNESFSPEYWKTNGMCNFSSWEIIDGGCHLRLYLSKNPVLKQNGGRVSLDKFDSLSFQVKLRPLTTLGKSLIHRSLITLSNTNPDILSIEQSEASGKDIQVVNITLTPTGYGMGVATLTIRPTIVSPNCMFADGSFTLIVQIHRAPGRRLHVNYPIPTCKPRADDGLYERPWKIDLPSCVTREELLSKKEVRRPVDEHFGHVFYSELPVNYRPPSPRGAEIPLSENVYNVDPSKPPYKDTYRISKETGVLSQCLDRTKRSECRCSVNDELSDDVEYTDCKRMVYTAKRGFRVDISVEYDRVMRDQDQHQVFFTPTKNWTVYVDEVNDRVGYTLHSETTPYLELIHNQTHLNVGRKHYDAKTLGVTLHGTGLFHFEVVLAGFESFDVVAGYFAIYIPNNELNHVQLVVIMLLTITVCMMFVFFGFLLVRRRLSSQLPFQPRKNTHTTKLE